MTGGNLLVHIADFVLSIIMLSKLGNLHIWLADM